MWAWQQWKGLGWSAIIYIAAISGIDTELYEAARVDGAGRFRLIWNITVPGLKMTYLVVLMLSAANFLSTGLEQYLLFSNPFNSSSTGRIVTLDLFTYFKAFPVSGASDFPFATAVGILKSVVGITLLFIINGISKITRNETII
jgi:multiple sugar transport system permease protein/putative aldouronate transport system permease protein